MKKLFLIGALVIAMLTVAGLQGRAQADAIDGCYGCYKKKNGQLRLVSSLSKCLKSEKPINLCQTYNSTFSNGNFIGTWKGSITFSSIGENIICSDSTVVLALNGTQLDGTLTGANCVGGNMGINNISGTVSNGTFSFNLPNSDPSDPDCANWNLPMTANLDANLTSMTVNGSGTVCGSGGGKQGTVTGSLDKQ